MRNLSNPDNGVILSDECRYVSEAMRLCNDPSLQMQLLLTAGVYHAEPMAWLSDPLNQAYFAKAVSQRPKHASDCLSLCLLANVFPGSLPILPYADDYLLGADLIARLLARITFDGEKKSDDTAWEAYAGFNEHVRNLDNLMGFHEPQAFDDCISQADLVKECMRRSAATTLGVELPEIKDLFPVQAIHERSNLISESLSSVLALNVGSQLAGTWTAFVEHPEVIKLKRRALEQIEQIPKTPLPRKKERITIRAWTVARSQALLMAKACAEPLPLRNRSEEVKLRFTANQIYDA